MATLLKEECLPRSLLLEGWKARTLDHFVVVKEREVSLVDCNLESLFLALVPMPLVDLALAKP